MTTKSIEQHLLPAASLGNQRALTVIRYGRQSSGAKAFIQAGLHADEAPTYMVMHHLINLLDQADAADKITGEIILLPVANPVGLNQWRDEVLLGRFDFYNSINFNRRHLDITAKVAERVKGRLGDDAAENVAVIRKATGEVLQSFEPKDEVEYLKHRQLSLAHDADIVLDLHCDLEAVMHVYLGTPLWPAAADLPAQLGAEAILLAEDSGVTPFDEACSRIWWQLAEKFPEYPIPPACIAATVELRGIADVSHEHGVQDAENFFKFLCRRGLVREDISELPPLRNEATSLRAVEQVKAPAPGVVAFLKAPGDRIAKGEVIAEIVNPLEADSEKRVTPVHSGTAGLLFSINKDRFAKPGRILAKIAGKTPLKAKGEDLLTL